MQACGEGAHCWLHSLQMWKLSQGEGESCSAAAWPLPGTRTLRKMLLGAATAPSVSIPSLLQQNCPWKHWWKKVCFCEQPLWQKRVTWQGKEEAAGESNPFLWHLGIWRRMSVCNQPHRITRQTFLLLHHPQHAPQARSSEIKSLFA